MAPESSEENQAQQWLVSMVFSEAALTRIIASFV